MPNRSTAQVVTVVLLLLLAGCGALNTPTEMKREPPAIELLVEAPIGEIYRRAAEGIRTCYTDQAIGFTHSQVYADFFESEGRAEISSKTVNAGWNRTDQIIALWRQSEKETRVQIWVAKVRPSGLEQWYRQLVTVGVERCFSLL